MASTVAEGDQTATLDTVHDLNTTTTAGVYVCQWDLDNLVKGDIVRVFVKTKVRSTSNVGIVFEGVYANDLLSDFIVHSPAIVSMHSLTMSLEQTDGTARVFPWKLIQIDA